LGDKMTQSRHNSEGQKTEILRFRQ
jgi:hypothetical protein